MQVSRGKAAGLLADPCALEWRGKADVAHGLFRSQVCDTAAGGDACPASHRYIYEMHANRLIWLTLTSSVASYYATCELVDLTQNFMEVFFNSVIIDFTRGLWTCAVRNASAVMQRSCAPETNQNTRRDFLSKLWIMCRSCLLHTISESL